MVNAANDTSSCFLVGSEVVMFCSHNPGFDNALNIVICCYVDKNFNTSKPKPAINGKNTK